MTEGKSEAQLRNEEEVRRLLKERGYSSVDYKKSFKKSERNFSFIPLILVLMVIALLFGGYTACQFFLNTRPIASEHKKQPAHVENNEEQLGFQTCLNAIDMSPISVDDNQYWTKNIARYEKFIACYEKYPTVSNQTEKADLQKRLADYKKYSSQSSKNEAESRRALAKSEKQYQDAIAKNQAEYQKKIAEIDKETKAKSDERAKQRAELDAQYEKQREERERQLAAAEAQKEAEEAAKKQACDNYKATYGDKTPQEIAEADSEVVRAKYNWTNAQSKVGKPCAASSNRVLTQSQREACEAKRSQQQQTADSYYSAYTSLLQQKITYYSNLKPHSCN